LSKGNGDANKCQFIHTQTAVHADYTIHQAIIKKFLAGSTSVIAHV